MKVTLNGKETNSFSLRDSFQYPLEGQKARMRGFKYKQLSVLIPSP
jgi:hypothetical protein